MTCISACSNYFLYGNQRHPGETGNLRTPYSRGWQTFIILTNYFFLVRPGLGGRISFVASKYQHCRLTRLLALPAAGRHTSELCHWS